MPYVDGFVLPGAMPIDMRRMVYGGFKVLVSA